MAGEKMGKKLEVPEDAQGRVKGCDFFRDGDALIVVVNLKNNFGPSKSGRTNVAGTTGGSVRIGGAMANIHVNVKPVAETGKK
jgi:hypothetical protein